MSDQFWIHKYGTGTEALEYLSIKPGEAIEEFLHVIEYSAYEKLQAELAAAKEANANCISLLLHESRMKKLEAKLAAAEKKVELMREALRKIDLALRIPAAEYIPSISDVFSIIDEALAEVEKLEGKDK